MSHTNTHSTINHQTPKWVAICNMNSAIIALVKCYIVHQSSKNDIDTRDISMMMMGASYWNMFECNIHIFMCAMCAHHRTDRVWAHIKCHNKQTQSHIVRQHRWCNDAQSAATESQIHCLSILAIVYMWLLLLRVPSAFATHIPFCISSVYRFMGLLWYLNSWSWHEIATPANIFNQTAIMCLVTRIFVRVIKHHHLCKMQAIHSLRISIAVATTINACLKLGYGRIALAFCLLF